VERFVFNKIEFGDCRETMRKWASDGIKVQTCVTSPPYYGLRDYGHEGQIGLEETSEEYINAMVEVFRCVWDVLADDGTLWLNIGDSYGSGKQLIGVPWRLALALQSDGWVLRQDIIWHKPNPMPESVKDRCTKAHEYIFLLSKSNKYFFDSEAMQETANRPEGPGNKTHRHSNLGIYVNGSAQKNIAKIGARETRNRRSVWSVATRPYKGAHFATFPPALIEPCILAGSRANDIVLDPFIGSGTTAQVALQHGRKYLGCELNQDYEKLQNERLRQNSFQLV
jgi:DNA modification methylase